VDQTLPLPNAKRHKFASQRWRHHPQQPQMLLQRSETSKADKPRRATHLAKTQHPSHISEETEEEVQHEQEADLLREERDEHDWLSQKSHFVER